MSASLLRTNVRVSCGLAFVALAVAPVVAAVYTAHDLNGPGHVESLAADVSKGQQVGYANTPARHAMLWSGPAGGAVDLHPAGFQFSQATAVHEGRQGGFAETTDVHQALGFSTTHAVVWSGTAASVVDLHPASGYSASRVSAVYGGRQFGSAAAGYFNDARDHAAMWEGASGSFADIHPAGFAVSRVTAASAGQLVGSAHMVSADPDASGVHAILWSGDGAAATDLRPAGFTYAEARGVSAGRQVGWGRGFPTGNSFHALLWHGSASGWADLNPDGLFESHAMDIAGDLVVGSGRGGSTGNQTHALLWTLDPGSGAGATPTRFATLDLHTLLPAGYTESLALGVDGDGQVVGQALHAASQQWHAVAWLPEPGAAVPLIVLAAAAASRRRR